MNKIKCALHNLQMTKSDRAYYIFSWLMFLLEYCWSIYFYLVDVDSSFLDILTDFFTVFSIVIYPLFYIFINYAIIMKNRIKNGH